jgi:hypothetical protein
MEICGTHISVLGWHSYKKIIVEAEKEYWVPPPKELELDLSSEDDDGKDSKCDDESDDDEYLGGKCELVGC